MPARPIAVFAAVAAVLAAVCGSAGAATGQVVIPRGESIRIVYVEDAYYDATRLLLRDLRHASTLDGGGSLTIDRAALAREVRSTTQFEGVSCRVTIDAASGNRVNDPGALDRCAAETSRR